MAIAQVINLFNKNYYYELIAEKGIKQKAIIRHLGISEPTLYNKLKGKTEFYLSEIDQIAEFLHLTLEEKLKLMGSDDNAV